MQKLTFRELKFRNLPLSTPNGSIKRERDEFNFAYIGAVKPLMAQSGFNQSYQSKHEPSCYWNHSGAIC